MNKLEPKYIAEIKRIVNKSLATTGYHAFIFGSWATGTARENSDIDIGIAAKQGGIDKIIIGNLRDELLESNVPYFTEVVPFDSVSDDFKELALTKIIPLTSDDTPQR